MNKKNYQSPSTYACELTGKAILSTSMKLGGPEETVSNSADIGFVKEQNSQSGNNSIWNEEW